MERERDMKRWRYERVMLIDQEKPNSMPLRKEGSLFLVANCPCKLRTKLDQLFFFLPPEEKFNEKGHPLSQR